YAMSADSIGWHAPADDPLHLIMADWKMTTRLQPYSMGRIVDIPGAFALLRPDPEINGRASIRVIDEHAPWNAGDWTIEASEGQVIASPGRSDASVELDIRALSQAYWGMPSLAELRARGLVTINSDEDFSLLSALLPAKTVWIDDEF